MLWTVGTASGIASDMAGLDDYYVNLDTFRGPLDLLLYLVKRDEIDILDIPIAHIAEQFRQYLEVLTLIDVDRAGDFLVMAATLLEIKSKLLLPQPEERAEPEEDPRRELVRQLIQYKRFKEAAVELERRAQLQSQRLPRAAVESNRRAGPAVLRLIELWDLVSAFGRLMRETMTAQPQAIVVDHTPLQVHMDTVLERLAGAERLTLSALFTAPRTRARLTGLFLAILELMRRFQIVACQEGVFGDIWVSLVTTEGDTEGGSA